MKKKSEKKSIKKSSIKRTRENQVVSIGIRKKVHIQTEKVKNNIRKAFGKLFTLNEIIMIDTDQSWDG